LKDKVTIEFGKNDSIDVNISITPDMSEIPVEKQAAVIRTLLMRYDIGVELYDSYGLPVARPKKKRWQFWKVS